jgi:hypothetical protein
VISGLTIVCVYKGVLTQCSLRQILKFAISGR